MFSILAKKEQTKTEEKVVELEKQFVAIVKEDKKLILADIIAPNKVQWIRFTEEKHIGKVFEFKDPNGIALRREQTGDSVLPKGLVKLISVNDERGYYKNIIYVSYPVNGSPYPQTLCLNRNTPIEIPSKEELDNLTETLKKEMRENLHTVLGYRETIGSDPEIFVIDKDKKVIPAFDFLKAKEVDPSIYWDGFQAEFTTMPNICLTGLMTDTQNKLKRLHDAAKQFNPNASLSISTVIDTPLELLNKTEDKFVQFGCMPSKNVYGVQGHIVGGRALEYRMAGGHIHFGCGTQDELATANIIRALDRLLGVACVSLFSNFDDKRRRQHYGLAGEYRTPKHGIEYRVLSNAWLSHPIIMNIVYDFGRQAFKLGQNDLLDLWDSNDEETIKCINNCDVELARTILTRNKNVMIKILNNYYNQTRNTPKPGVGVAEMLFDIFMNGMETVVADPTDIYKNWGLHTYMNYHYPIELYFKSDRKKV